jgi:hypothetical protein
VYERSNILKGKTIQENFFPKIVKYVEKDKLVRYNKNKYKVALRAKRSINKIIKASYGKI